MTPDAEPRRRQGRPRDPAADEAIISAVFDEIAEAGFTGFSVESVAGRAGVGKATIYRRWPTREELIMAAAERIMVGDDLPDTGTIRGDLIAWYWSRYRSKDPEKDGRLMGQVIVESAVNPDLKKLMQRFLAERRRSLSEIFDRARDRGECGDVDVALVLDMISGALIHQSLFGANRVRRVDVERYVDVVLTGQQIAISPT